MKNYRFVILSTLFVILASSLFSQTPRYFIADQNVCSDTFTVDVELEYTGNIINTDFGVKFDPGAVDLIESEVLLNESNLFTNEGMDSIGFSISYFPSIPVSGNSGIVRLTFVKQATAGSSTVLSFLSNFPRPQVGDENQPGIRANTTPGTISFTELAYLDCPNDIVVDNDPDQCRAIVNWTPPTIDSCQGGMITETLPSQSSGDFFDVGTTNISYTATNENGSTANCDFTITVNDTQSPSLTCPEDITVVGDANGNSIVNNIGLIAQDDNCDIDQVSYNIVDSSNTSVANGLNDASGETFPAGMNTVSYTVTDIYGNDSTCSFIVNSLRESQLVIIDISSDQILECSDSLYTLEIRVQDSALLKSLQFSLNWNQGILAFNSVEPSDQPLTPNSNYSGITMGSIDMAGEMGYLLSTPGGTPYQFVDGELLFTISFNILERSPSSVLCGSNPLILQATDPADNEVPVSCNSATSQYAQDDQGANLISETCPDTLTFFANSMTCMARVDYDLPLFNDDCDGDSLVSNTLLSGFSPPSNLGLGTYLNIHGYTDAEENLSVEQCTTIIIVNDTVAPSIDCNMASTDVYLDNLGNVIVDINSLYSSATDDCSNEVNVTADNIDFDCSEIGMQTIVLTATDESENSTSCAVSVNILDTLPPNITCQARTLSINEDGILETTPSQFVSSSADNCGTVNLQISQTNFDCQNVGDTLSITIYGIDDENNVDSCLTSLIVVDDILPEIQCPRDVMTETLLDSIQIFDLSPTFVDDNCDDFQVRYELTGATTGMGLNDASGRFFNIGITQVGYYIDDIGGNVDSCFFDVEVVESASSIDIICPNITRNYSTAPGRCDTTLSFEPIIIAQGGVMLDSVLWFNTLDRTQNGRDSMVDVIVQEGTTDFVFIAYFDNNELDSCTFRVTVNDDEAPLVLDIQNDTTLYSSMDSCIVPMTWDSIQASDNCDENLSIDLVGRPDGNTALFSPGTDTIKYRISDDLGNSTDTFFIVTTIDTVPPTIVCPNDTVIIVPSSVNDTIINNLTWLDRFDNCEIGNNSFEASGATDTISPTGDSIDVSGLRFNRGITDVSYTVTDVHGNSTVCSFTVTIRGDDFPPYSCPNDTTVFVNNMCLSDSILLLPMADTLSFDSIKHSYSGATIKSLTSGARIYDVFNRGTTEISYFFYSDGNVEMCSFNVLALDTIAPSVECPSDRVVLVSQGTLDTTVFDLAPVQLIDNCGVLGSFYSIIDMDGNILSSDTSSMADASGSNFTLGLHTINYYAFDGSNNIDSCTFTLEVRELTEADTISCPLDTTLFLDEECRVRDVTLIPNGNLGVYDSIYFDLVSGRSIRYGGLLENFTLFSNDYTVIYYFEQDGEVTETCEFKISVVDSLSPSIVCPSDTVITVAPLTVDTLITLPYTSQVDDNCDFSLYYNYTLNGNLNISDTVFNDSIQFSERLPLGVHEIEFIVFDESGLADTCYTLISVQPDQISYDCPADTAIYSELLDCKSTLNIDLINPNFNADSSIIIVENQDVSDTLRNALGSTYTFGTDTSYVNIDFYFNDTLYSCEYLVEIVDTIGATIVCPSDTTITLSESDSIIVILDSPVIEESCDYNNYYYFDNNGDLNYSDTILNEAIIFEDTLRSGTYEVFFVVYDDTNAADTCSTTILIEDNILTFDCPQDTTHYVGIDSCDLDLVVGIIGLESNIDSALTTISNQGVTDTITLDSLYSFNLGTSNVNIDIYRGDSVYNCSYNVVLIDTLISDIVCQEDMTFFVNSNDSTYSFNDWSFEVSPMTDNCGALDTNIYVTSDTNLLFDDIFIDSLAIFTLGQNNVNLYISDISENADTCNFDLSFIYFECPQDIATTTLDNSCFAILDGAELQFGPDSLITDIYYEFVSAIDTQIISTEGLTENPNGDTLEIGEYVLRYYLVADGDTVSCSTNISVIDGQAPLFVDCPQDTVQVFSNVEDCSYVFDLPTPEFLDNCSTELLIEQNIMRGDTLEPGFYELEYIISDSLGADTCQFVINVIESQLVLECPDTIIVDLDGNILQNTNSLIDSIGFVTCDSIEIFHSSLSGIVECKDTIAEALDSLYDGRAILTRGITEIPYSLSDGMDTLVCNLVFEVINGNRPEISLGDSTRVCLGSSIELSYMPISDSTSQSVEWLRDSVVISTQDTLVLSMFNVDSSGYYYLRGITEAGCAFIDSIFVGISPSAEFNFISNNNGCASLGDSISYCFESLSSAASSFYVVNGDTIVGNCIEIDSLVGEDLGTYRVSAINEFGCIWRDSFVLDTASSLVTPPIFLSADTICLGETIDLATIEYDFDGVQYNWFADSLFGNGLPENVDSFELFGIAPILDSIRYSIYITTNGCASDTNFVDVSVLNAPMFELSTNAPITCYDELDSLIIIAELEGEDSLYTLAWSGPNDFISDSTYIQFDSLFDGLSGNYILNAQFENGCSTLDSLDIVLSESLEAPAILGDSAICLGDSLNLFTTTVDSNYNYSWTSDNTGSGLLGLDSLSSNINILPTSSDSILNIRLSYSDSTCTSDTSEFFVLINQALVPNLISNSPFYCLDNDTTLLFISDTNHYTADYTWIAPDGMIYDSSYFEIDSIGFNDGGTYNLQILSAEGCITMDSIMIQIDSLAPTPAIVGESIYCPGDTILLSIENPIDGFEYIWDGPNEFTDIGDSIFIMDAKNANEGTYFVSSASESCDSDTTFFRLTDVIDSPELNDTTIMVEFETSNSSEIGIGNFNSSSSYDLEITSQPENGSIEFSLDSTGLTLIYTPDDGFSGTDITSLSLCNVNCPEECGTAVISYVVSNDTSECEVFNVLTPDNDGQNEFLVFRCLENGGETQFPDNELVIFNQWGDEIYRASPYVNEWNGTYEGEPVPDGTYFYLFKLSDDSPLEKGFITVFK